METMVNIKMIFSAISLHPKLLIFNAPFRLCYSGCDGGEDFRAYQWIKKVGGIPTEESYGGYLGQDGYCHVNYDNVTLVAPITGIYNFTTKKKQLQIP